MCQEDHYVCIFWAVKNELHLKPSLFSQDPCSAIIRDDIPECHQSLAFDGSLNQEAVPEAHPVRALVECGR